MQSPSPSSAPSPLPFASLLPQPTTNGFQEHVTHSGNPARPSIHFLPQRTDRPSTAEYRQADSEDGKTPALSTCLPRDGHVLPNVDINLLSAKAVDDVDKQTIQAPQAMPKVAEGRSGDHEASESDQVSAYDSPIAFQYTQGLNENVSTRDHDTLSTEVGDIVDSSVDQWIEFTPTQDGYLLDNVQMQPQGLQSMENPGQVVSLANPYVDSMGSSTGNIPFPLCPDTWGYNMETPTPQTFQNQMYPMNFTPLPMQQHNFWAQDLTQMMQSQIISTSNLIPLTIPVVQRTPCSWQFCTESFVRASDLRRHIESVHLGIKYHCFWIGCHNNRGKGYCRVEKLRTHQREKHGFA